MSAPPQKFGALEARALRWTCPKNGSLRIVEPASNINARTGEDITIRERQNFIREVVGFEVSIFFDETIPYGMPGKLLDVTRIDSLGWEPRISLHEGLRRI